MAERGPRRKPRLFDRAERALATFAERGTPECAFFVPGRIEVLGKHTDYAGGRSLLCAIERGIALVASPRSDAGVRLLDVSDGSTVEVALAADLPPATGWGTYPAAVARRLARNFPGARTGADIAFFSDLPPASGLSSSSAFVVGVLLALAHINVLGETAAYRDTLTTREDMAAYAAAIESGADFRGFAGDLGVGTRGGSEDHTAILCGEPDRLLQYAFCPTRRERAVGLPRAFALVVGVSGVAAEKTGGARDDYNRAARAAQTILELWRASTGYDDASLADALARDDGPALLRDVVAKAPEREFPRSALLDRLDHFIEESERIVPTAAELIARADWPALGDLVDRSQANAERWLGNQVRETIALARLARGLGAAAASAFGAGFGGSVWALVPTASASAFAESWADAYRRAFPSLAERSAFFPVRPAAAASAE